MPKAEYLSVREAAEELGVSHWVIWSACRHGSLPSIRPGTRPGSGFYRIKRSDFEAYIRASTVAPPLRAVAECSADVLLIDRFARRAR